MAQLTSYQPKWPRETGSHRCSRLQSFSAAATAAATSPILLAGGHRCRCPFVDGHTLLSAAAAAPPQPAGATAVGLRRTTLNSDRLRLISPGLVVASHLLRLSWHRPPARRRHRRHPGTILRPAAITQLLFFRVEIIILWLVTVSGCIPDGSEVVHQLMITLYILVRASSSKDGSGSVISTVTGGRTSEIRETRGPTTLKRPRNFQKIEITPKGDMYFNYVHFTPDLPRQVGSVLGTALRNEYPGVVKESAGPGRPTRKRLAFSWGQYYGERDQNDRTAADRVKEEFWSFFTADNELLEELDNNIDIYCQKRVPKILCQARVDAVKKFYGRSIKGKNPSSIELEYEQYKTCKLDWFSNEAWDVICRWWTSEKYEEQRKRGQEARFANEDYAQERGGSLPFPTIQQNLEYRFGREKAGGLNTYKVQMGGFKASLKGNGNVYLLPESAKENFDYIEATDKEYGDNWQESDDLDGNVIYRTFGGLKNGRFAMGDGSIKKSEVLAAVKHNKTRPSGGSYQAMQRQNEELQLEVAKLREPDEEREQMLHDQQEIISQQQVFLKQQQGLMTEMCQRIGMSIPPEILASWRSQQTPSSGSHMDSHDNRQQQGMEHE
ncbi:hypothetical protein ACP4OV_001390 [Aristida adscensionis]